MTIFLDSLGVDNTLLGYVTAISLPLQGFFNLVIYMQPKIVSAKKRGGETVSWCGAIKEAFWSRGKDRRKKGPTRQKSSLRGSNHFGERKGMTTFQFTIWTNKKKPRLRREPQPEEEKREIQPPENTGPRQQLTNLTYAQND